MNQKIKKIVKYFLVLVLAGVSVSALAQWTPPTTTPPSGNVSLPINTSTTLQEKLGSIVAGAMQTNSQLFVGSSNFRIEETDSSPNAGFVRFGDNSGWRLIFGRSKESTSGGLNNGTTGAIMTITDASRVGIGTTTPATTLDVAGAVKVGASSATCSSGIAGAQRYNNNAIEFCNGTVWTALSGGGGGFWAASGNNIYNTNTSPGVVNIKTDTVVDNNKTIGSFNTLGNGETFLWPRASDNASYLNYGSNGFHIRNNSSVRIMFMTNSGNVGIGTGTDTPGQKLQVNGNIALQNSGVIGSGSAWGTPGNANSASLQLYDSNGNTVLNNQGYNIDLRTGNITRALINSSGLEVNGTVKISGGTPGAGKVLTSDANGLASWQTPGATASGWTISSTNMFPTNLSYNVGIGTVSPTNKLSIQGNANINGVLTVGEITNNGKVLSNNVNTLVVNGGIKLLNHIGNTTPFVPNCDANLRGTLFFNADNGNQIGGGVLNNGDGLVICTYDRVSNTYNWRRI
jgi:hypothetical protein